VPGLEPEQMQRPTLWDLPLAQTYNDAITGTKLLAACMAGYEMLDGSTATSCEGGLQGLGEAGDARTPQLLGVGCIDMNLVVSLDVLEVISPNHLLPSYSLQASPPNLLEQGRTDYADFQTEMERQSKLCPRATVTESLAGRRRAQAIAGAATTSEALAAHAS
jgi:hypothetical protein